ncbi:MAG: FAD-dependent oxidoreductase, partial [Planctomycetes bacterium]|nr:FAD-dependent oxidoreductase [Planctomycetota bacterium]
MTLLLTWRVRRTAIVLFLLTAFLGRSVVAAEVNESARRLPVAYEVDVVVLGGGTGAVAAAVAAAEQGAKVFLAAPRPYLGDDMTATLRLWLEEGEQPVSPLARQIFADDVVPGGTPDPNRIRYSYEADLPSSPVHRDTNPPSRLIDGAWGIASSQSVQYDGSVEIIADLGKSQPVAAARMM